MSNLAVLPPLTRTRTLRFALRQILLPLCWSKMMMGRSCWTHSPLGWVSHLRTSHHLSSPLTPSEARFPRLSLFLADDIASISQHLKLLSYCLSGLADSPSPASAPPEIEPMAPKLLSSLSPDEVVHLVHCPGSLPPPVCPCNWSNRSDTKTH